MRKMVMVMVVAAFMVLIALGCDARRAQIEKAKSKFRLTSEQSVEVSQNKAKVDDALKKYKADFGEYPQTLEELKAQGYVVPDPAEGWTWLYQLNPTLGPQLQPVKKQ